MIGSTSEVPHKVAVETEKNNILKKSFIGLFPSWYTAFQDLGWEGEGGREERGWKKGGKGSENKGHRYRFMYIHVYEYMSESENECLGVWQYGAHIKSVDECVEASKQEHRGEVGLGHEGAGHSVVQHLLGHLDWGGEREE